MKMDGVCIPVILSQTVVATFSWSFNDGRPTRLYAGIASVPQDR